MQPLGNKILVRDITEKEVITQGGIILDPSKGNHYRKVKIEAVSPDSGVLCFNEEGEIVSLKKGDVCLANPGGVELEAGLWLCNENLIDAKL